MCHHLANKLCWLRYGSFESRDIPDQDSKKSFASFQGGKGERERASEREGGRYFHFKCMGSFYLK